MIPVSAETIESPVTTVYSTAPNAAAAMVPMAYSRVAVYNPWGSGVVTLPSSTLTNGARVAQSVQLAGRHFGARGAHLRRGPAQPRPDSGRGY